jgi:hypothetical protein
VIPWPDWTRAFADHIRAALNRAALDEVLVVQRRHGYRLKRFADLDAPLRAELTRLNLAPPRAYPLRTVVLQEAGRPTLCLDVVADGSRDATIDALEWLSRPRARALA